MLDIRSMDVLETLCAALGLATLAGINLYLTVCVTGMAVQFGWVALPSHLHDLSILGDPWVIAISGALYLLEFFADKVPWIDSANDAVHTFIRPIGGALLAVLALGEANPAIQVSRGPSRRWSVFDCSCRQGWGAFDGQRFARTAFQYWPELGRGRAGFGRPGAFALASCDRVQSCGRRFGSHLDDVSEALAGNPPHRLASLAQAQCARRRSTFRPAAGQIAGSLSARCSELDVKRSLLRFHASVIVGLGCARVILAGSPAPRTGPYSS